jgi:hypothetical protein
MRMNSRMAALIVAALISNVAVAQTPGTLA